LVEIHHRLRPQSASRPPAARVATNNACMWIPKGCNEFLLATTGVRLLIRSGSNYSITQRRVCYWPAFDVVIMRASARPLLGFFKTRLIKMWSDAREGEARARGLFAIARRRRFGVRVLPRGLQQSLSSLKSHFKFLRLCLLVIWDAQYSRALSFESHGT
jgi:hypothetical protein